MSKYVLSHLEPQNVWRFFQEICAIPHGSGNEAALSSYVEGFAQKRGLFCYRDDANNVFIRLPATEGYGHVPSVMLQGHLDMVCEKDSDCDHDFLTDGLKLLTENDKLGAKGTTLGGDDGIAVAMMLALLDAPPAPHPTLECLFTVSEETGLEGAHAFDPSAVKVTAKTMINLDSECESVITAGCAGGMRTDIVIPTHAVPFEGTAVEICLDEFSGGHSGVEIHEGHTNAIKALGEIISYATDICDVQARLVSLQGGGKDNAIPRHATAVLALQTPEQEVAEAFCDQVLQAAEWLRSSPNLIVADKAFTCAAQILSEMPDHMINEQQTAAILSLLCLARDGVLSMNAHIQGLVAYSRNLGITQTLTTHEGAPSAVQFSFSTRSACEAHLDSAERELSLLAKTCTQNGMSAIVKHRARYPGWDYSPVSPIRDLWLSKAEQLYGVTPRVEAIHAGLECGILLSKMPGMDIISVGPDMWDIHTPRERLGISSTARLYTLLCQVITALCE